MAHVPKKIPALIFNDPCTHTHTHTSSLEPPNKSPPIPKNLPIRQRWWGKTKAILWRHVAHVHFRQGICGILFFGVAV